MLLVPFGGPLWVPFGARDGGPGRSKLVFFWPRQRLSDFLVSGGLWGCFCVVFGPFFLSPLRSRDPQESFPPSLSPRLDGLGLEFDTNICDTNVQQQFEMGNSEPQKHFAKVKVLSSLD